MHQITIQKKSKTPIYRQLQEQLADLIYSGELREGDALPTEKELSEATGVSLGTIKHAYAELSAIGLLNRVQGSGTYVNRAMDPALVQVNQKSNEIVDGMLDELFRMRLSDNEIQTLIESKLQWRRQKVAGLRIAVVDCNIETLSLISGQLNKFSDVNVTEMILGDLQYAPHRLTMGYDLILTTKTHYLQLSELAPTVVDKIIKVAIVPSIQTSYKIARLHNNMTIGIWCMSQEFAEAVYQNVSALGHRMMNMDYYLDSDAGDLKSFLSGKDVLVIPFDYIRLGAAEDAEMIQQFQRQGGQVIPFDYRIDEGSMIHVSYELERCRKQKNSLAKN